MIPPLLEAGYRIIAPDFIGFGKSDKITDVSLYSHELHVASLLALLESLDLQVNHIHMMTLIEIINISSA